MISFRSKITQKVLNYFFINPDIRCYINELAKILEVDPKNLYSKLKELEEKEGILQSEFQGQQRYFFLNKKYPHLKEYSSMFLKTVGFEKILRDALLKIKGITSAYIFGSYAKNKMDILSDIDILVVGDYSMIKLQGVINILQKRTRREINVVNMNFDEFEIKRNKKSELIYEIMKDKYIRVI